jgi:hypothetical protein
MKKNYNGPVLMFILGNDQLRLNGVLIQFGLSGVPVFTQRNSFLLFLPLRNKINSNQWSRWMPLYEATNEEKLVVTVKQNRNRF